MKIDIPFNQRTQ